METVSTILEGLGLAIIHSIWHGVLLAGFTWLLFKFEPRSDYRFNMAFGAMAILFFLFLFNFFYFLIKASSSGASAEQVIVILDSIFLPDQTTEYKFDITNYLFSAIALFWLVGFVFFAVKQIIEIFKHEQWIRHNVRTLSAFDRHYIVELANFQHLKYVKLATGIASPVVTGFFKPLVLLPLTYTILWPPDQLQSLLLHEWEHIKRKDHITLAFQQWCTIFFFYHPVVWWLNKLVHQEREFAVDHAVLKNGTNKWIYAKALYNTGVHGVSVNRNLELAADKGNINLLQSRIEKIFFHNKKVNQMKNSWIVFVLGIIFIVSGFGMVLRADFNNEDNSFQIIETAIADTIPPAPKTTEIPSPPIPPTPPAANGTTIAPAPPNPPAPPAKEQNTTGFKLRIDTIISIKMNESGVQIFDTAVVKYQISTDQGYLPLKDFNYDFGNNNKVDFQFDKLLAGKNFDFSNIDTREYFNTTMQFHFDSLPTARRYEMTEEMRREFERAREQIMAERETIRREHEKVRRQMREEMPEIRRQMEKEILEAKSQALENTRMHREEMREFKNEQMIEMQKMIDALREEVNKLKEELNSDN